MKKKIISLMVAVFMVMAIIPFGAIGASAALVEVDSIAISGVGVPVVGEKPDYANMVSDKAPYTQIGRAHV